MRGIDERQRKMLLLLMPLTTMAHLSGLIPRVITLRSIQGFCLDAPVECKVPPCDTHVFLWECNVSGAPCVTHSWYPAHPEKRAAHDLRRATRVKTGSSTMKI